MTERDDAELLGAVATHKDERAFRELYDRHTTYLFRLALRLVGGEESSAEAVVHDAWIRAIERAGSYGGRSQVRTWIAGFVVNCVRELSRPDRREEPLEELPLDDGALAAIPDRVDLERAVNLLPPRQRTVFVLHDVEDWTHNDIARLLAIDPGTSRSQLARARAALRETLKRGTP